MKKKNLWNIFCGAALGLQLLAEGTAMYHVLRLNMLPDLYVAILAGGFLLLTLLSAGLLFLHGKKPVSTLRRILGMVLALLIAAGSCALVYVTDQLHDTMEGIADPSVSTASRNVYVLKENGAKDLSDARDYTFGYVLGYDTENTDKTLQVLEKELGKIVVTQGFDTVFAMVDALYAGSIDALILNDAYLTIFEDWVGYEDFGERTRVLYTALIEEEKPDPVPETTQQETVQSGKPDSELPVTERPFLIYLSGSDTRYKKLGSKTRSDVNILAAVNPLTKQVLLLNTPRDYYVENPAGGGALDKLTHCGIYGTENSVEALENLYNTSIDGYAKINFAGFETLIDEVGGVTVYSTKGFTSGGITIVKGNNTLNGKEALIFARERYSLSGGDRDRGKNQMKILEAVIKKLTTSTALISNYADILRSLKGMLKTDISTEDISALVKLQLEEMPQWEVLTFAVSGKTGKDKNYSMPGLKASVMYQDEALVAQASDLLARMLAGQTLTEADMKIS
ncbi:MAG: LCP family protein [Oscillospiraceae bacterium]|nr:LCP family protein [Oscillospiraceae bacterium]